MNRLKKFTSLIVMLLKFTLFFLLFAIFFLLFGINNAWLLHVSRTAAVTMFTFVVLGLASMSIFGGYSIGINKSKPIISSLSLATFFTDVITYLQLCIMNTNSANNQTFKLEDLDILLIVYVLQLIMIIALTYFGNHVFFTINSPEKCVGCANCVRNCPAAALSLDGGIHIDTTKCIGCAKCIAECPLKLFSPSQVELPGSTFMERLVEYAYVAWKTKPMVFIKLLANISASCDCSSRAPKPFCDDIGMLASKDIVAIDQASFDLVAEKHKCDDPFLKESGKSGLSQLDYAQSLGMGNRKYVLIEIK